MSTGELEWADFPFTADSYVNCVLTINNWTFRDKPNSSFLLHIMVLEEIPVEWMNE